MNLLQIREHIQNELQRAPETQDWKNDVANVVNAKYLARMTAKRWPFRVVEASLRLRADETGVTFKVASSTGYPLELRTVAGVHAVRYHDLDALLFRSGDEDDSYRRFGRIAGGRAWTAYWRQVMRNYDGHNIEGWPDPDLSTTKNVQAYLEAPPATGYLDVTYTDGVLRHDRYQLPFDCAEIIGIVSREDSRGEIPLVNRTRERQLMLNDRDPAGSPEAYLLDDPVDAGPAPRKTMVAAVTNGGFGLAAGTYRYFYVFGGKGAMTGPSPIVEATTTGGASKIDFTILEGEPENRYWRTKFVFREDNGDGVFRYLTSVQPGDTTFTDNGTNFTPDETFVWDDRMAAPRKTVRFWPRPASDQWVHVQYLTAPRRLQNDQDTPQMPDEYHMLLVHDAVVHLAARYDQSHLVGVHSKLRDELEAMMLSKEIHRNASTHLQGWEPRGGRALELRTKPATMS